MKTLGQNNLVDVSTIDNALEFLRAVPEADRVDVKKYEEAIQLIADIIGNTDGGTITVFV